MLAGELQDVFVCLQGQMCAALLGWPQATFASEVLAEEDSLRVMREVDEGQQQVAVRLPAVVTTDLRLNTPRFPPSLTCSGGVHNESTSQ